VKGGLHDWSVFSFHNFCLCARQEFYQAKTTPAAAASRRTRRAAPNPGRRAGSHRHPRNWNFFNPKFTLAKPGFARKILA
jgi:hypothetical protein